MVQSLGQFDQCQIRLRLEQLLQSLGVWTQRVVTPFCPLGRKNRYGNHASRQRPNDAENSSRASKVERKDQRFSPALRAEPHNRYEVALSLDNHRCAYGSNEAKKLHFWPGPFQPCPCDTLAEKCLGDLNDDRTFHDVRRAGLDIRDILLDPFARDFQAFVGACLVRANRH